MCNMTSSTLEGKKEDNKEKWKQGNNSDKSRKMMKPKTEPEYNSVR